MECFELCCQSPRVTNWFSLFGLGTAYVSRPQGSGDVDRYFKSATAGALKRAVGIWLSGNGVRVTGSRMLLATPVDWQAADSSLLKSPLRAACVGTNASDLRRRGPLSRALVAREEENLVFPDRTADRAPKLVPPQACPASARRSCAR